VRIDQSELSRRLFLLFVALLPGILFVDKSEEKPKEEMAVNIKGSNSSFSTV
jgi:hypothetical protein